MKKITASVIFVFILSALSYGDDKFVHIKAAIDAGIPDVAVMELKRMEKNEVKNPLYWFYLGTACRNVGRYDESIEALENGLRLEKESGMLYHGLGLTYAKIYKTGEAMDAMTKAIEKEPANARYHNDLGLIFLAEKEPDRAIGSFTIAYRLSRTGDFLKNIAFAYGMKKDYEKAKETMIKAFPLHEVYYTLGLMHELNGDGNGAAEMYEMAVTVNRGYEPALNKLKRSNSPGGG